MVRIWDGFLSFVSALATLAVALIPAWFAHLAVGAELAPTWGYAFIALLAFVAGLVALDFIKKAFKGIAPARSRAR